VKEVLYLYGTSACHLCELAVLVVDAVLHPDYFEIKRVDIVDSDDLVEKYGARIPVLKILRTEDELGWPFNEAELIAFIDKALL
jgi:hypothetical protein